LRLGGIVAKGGRDWDELLSPILVKIALGASTGVTLFSLMYGRDARIQTSLGFNQPKPDYSQIVKSEFA